MPRRWRGHRGDLTAIDNSSGDGGGDSIYILSNHDGSSGVSIYKLNEDDFDSDDAYSEGADDDSGSICSADFEPEGSVDPFAAQARFDSEYDVDSRARRLRHRRLVARLATRGCPEFVAAGTKIVGLDSGSLYRASTAVHFNFDVRTRLVSATPPLRSPKKYDAFWAIGGTVYALDTSADEPSYGKERCVFERLGPEPQRHYGTWQWEALPRGRRSRWTISWRPATCTRTAPPC